MKKGKKQRNQIIAKYMQENIREILTISIIFLIGIIFGIMLINNVKEERENGTNQLYKSICRKHKTREKVRFIKNIKRECKEKFITRNNNLDSRFNCNSEFQ